jgi:YD repeat-containing protein
MVDWDGTTTYAYSARGELTGKTEPTGLRMTMLYDSVGNRTTLREPDGYSYTFGYDALNRCIRLRNPNAYVYTFQYDAAAKRTTLLDSTGITRAYQYDPVGRLTTQVDSNSGGTGLVTFVDAYDAVGNRIGRNHDGVATTWLYDLRHEAARLIVTRDRSDGTGCPITRALRGGAARQRAV